MNRLFEIVYILLNQQTITAKELSKRLEVSVRTIYRDIETLSASGIPVYMSKGRGGGIRLLDQFVLNKSILSEHEQKEILTALQGLKAIKYPDVNSVLPRLESLFGQRDFHWIDVDFSHWGSQNDDKFAQLKTAVIHSRTIVFDYLNSAGKKTNREAEPLQLWFKNRSWYVKANCLTKQAYRIFKLSRMENIRVTDKTFDRDWSREPLAETELVNCHHMVDLTVHLQPAAAYRVYDEFDESDIQKNEDGSFTVTVTYPEDEWVYGYILSFGDYAEVIEPERVRDKIQARLEKMLLKYVSKEKLPF